MTDTTDMNDYNQRVITEFRANDGQVAGLPPASPILLLHTVGAKSGRELVSPLVYHRDGERFYIFASANGANRSPAWYHNLVANPDVTVEWETETLPMRATVVTGPERDRLYAEQAGRATQFEGYQRKTSRVIPVVALDPA